MAEESLNPILKKLIKSAGGAFKAARVAKDPMAGLTCPAGLYFGQLKRIQLTEIGKAGSEKTPSFRFTVIIICIAATIKSDDGYELSAGDMTYAGEQAQILHMLGDTEKKSIQESYERFCFDLQKLGVDTSKMIQHEGERTADDETTLTQVMAFLSDPAMSDQGGQPFVSVAVTAKKDDPSIKYCNLRAVVLKDDVDKLIGQDAGIITGSVQLEDEKDAAVPEYTLEDGTPCDAEGNPLLVEGGNVATAEAEQYQLEDGTPCDAEGNPLTTGYEQIPEPAPEPPKPKVLPRKVAAPVKVPPPKKVVAAKPAATVAPAKAVKKVAQKRPPV